MRGLNTVGLRRAGYADEDVRELEKAYRSLFGRKKPLSVAMSEYDVMNGINPHVKQLVEFLHRRNSGRHGRYLEGQRRSQPASIVEPPAETAPAPTETETET